MRLILIIPLLVFLTACSPSTSSPSSSVASSKTSTEAVQKPVRFEKGRDAFTVDLPNDCNTSTYTGPDFDIIRITCKGTALVGVYTGNAPNVDDEDRNLTLHADVPGRQVIVDPKAPNTPWGYLWQTGYEWPSYLHVMISAKHRHDAMAQKIAASVRPTETHQGPQ